MVQRTRGSKECTRDDQLGPRLTGVVTPLSLDECTVRVRLCVRGPGAKPDIEIKGDYSHWSLCSDVLVEMKATNALSRDSLALTSMSEQ